MNDLMFGAGDTRTIRCARADLVRKGRAAQGATGLCDPAFESSTASGLYSRRRVAACKNLDRASPRIDLTGNPAPGLAWPASTVPRRPTASTLHAAQRWVKRPARWPKATSRCYRSAADGLHGQNFGLVGMGSFLAGMLGREIPTGSSRPWYRTSSMRLSPARRLMGDYLRAQPGRDLSDHPSRYAHCQGSVMGQASGKIVQVAISTGAGGATPT